jgi:hypothetical protein
VSFTGTIIVESGATAIDRKQGGASLFNHANDTGSYEIHEGAIVIVNSQAIGPTYQDVILVGPASGNNKGQVLQLNSGALTITAKSYELEDGTATTLVVDHTVPASSSGSDDGVILSAKSALTVAGGGNLACLSNNDFLKNSANGAKIVLQNENAYLSLLDDTNAITSPVFTITGAPWTMPADPVDGYYRAYITGPAVLVKTAGVWVKQ